MINRIKPESKRKFRDSIRDTLIDGLGVRMKLIIPAEKSECPNCYYDDTTESSINECKWTYAESLQKQRESEEAGGLAILYKYFIKGRCPICKGTGYIQVYLHRKWLTAKVNWEPDSPKRPTKGSRGGGSVPVEVKALPQYFKHFKAATKVIIDGVICRIEDEPTMSGLGNKSIMHIIVYTADKAAVELQSVKRYR